MTAFSSQPLPEEPTPASSPTPRGRRRERRWIAPLNAEGRAAVAEDMARRMDPTLDYFLFLCLAAALTSLGLLLNAHALLVAAALVAPVLTPVFGVAISGVTGSVRYWRRSLAALAVGFGLALALAMLLAWLAARFFGLSPITTAALSHSQLTFFDFLLALAGGGLTALALARSPDSVRLPGAALAYETLPALGGIAFALAAGQPRLAHSALAVFLGHWAVFTLAAALVYWALGFRPVRSGRVLLGYDLAALTAGALLVITLGVAGWAALAYFRQPAATALILATATASPTPTLASPTSAPSATSTQGPGAEAPTPTLTLTPTPSPTLAPSPTPVPVMARVQSSEGVGAVLRDSPDGRIIASLPEQALVRVLEVGPIVGEYQWLRIVDAFGNEGWMASVNAATMTPVP